MKADEARKISMAALNNKSCDTERKIQEEARSVIDAAEHIIKSAAGDGRVGTTLCLDYKDGDTFEKRRIMESAAYVAKTELEKKGFSVEVSQNYGLETVLLSISW